MRSFFNSSKRKPISDFGEGGIVDLSKDLGPRVTNINYNIKGPATVCRDTIVFGCVINDLTTSKTMPPGNVLGYDVRTGKGHFIFYNVGCLNGDGKFDVIAIGKDREEASSRLEVEMPARLNAAH